MLSHALAGKRWITLLSGAQAVALNLTLPRVSFISWEVPF